MPFEHVTVLRREAVQGLKVKTDGTYVDCTVGGGGHAIEIAKHLTEGGLLIAFDQDEHALASSKKRLANCKNDVIFFHENFQNMYRILKEHHFETIDGFLFDLGVSSPQLDTDDRGFSYRYDAELDMRMDQNQSLTAKQIVNEWSYEQLVRIFFQYGEERFSKQIARTIERNRKQRVIQTTFDLVDIVKEAIPAPARRRGGHPARRIFQALRIAVNDELNAFYNALHDAAKLVTVGGRIVVITFHSLEDRLCKHAFRHWSTPIEGPKNLPIIPEHHQAPFKEITRKPILPTEEEVKQNKRARSAKLRIVEKVKEWNDQFIFKKGWRKR